MRAPSPGVMAASIYECPFRKSCSPFGSVIERLGRHLPDELIMFPQGGLQFRKNGFRFGLLGRCGLGAKLSNAFVERGDLHNF